MRDLPKNIQKPSSDSTETNQPCHWPALIKVCNSACGPWNWGIEGLRALAAEAPGGNVVDLVESIAGYIWVPKSGWWILVSSIFGNLEITLWLCQHSYWKWPYSGFSQWKSWLSIVMLVYQRVGPAQTDLDVALFKKNTKNNVGNSSVTQSYVECYTYTWLVITTQESKDAPAILNVSYIPLYPRLYPHKNGLWATPFYPPLFLLHHRILRVVSKLVSGIYIYTYDYPYLSICTIYTFAISLVRWMLYGSMILVILIYTVIYM